MQSEVTNSRNTKTRECHTGNIYIASVGKLKIYAGGWSRKATTRNIDIIIDLSGKNIQNIVTMNKKAKTMFTFSETEKAVISIDWEDYEKPELSYRFWYELADQIKKLSNQDTKVLIACFGGHGRTGTALCALLYALDKKFRDIDTVKYVRDNYCSKAVESKSQMEYLKAMGIKTQEEPSRWTRDWYTFIKQTGGVT